MIGNWEGNKIIIKYLFYLLNNKIRMNQTPSVFFLYKNPFLSFTKAVDVLIDDFINLESLSIILSGSLSGNESNP